MFMTFNAKGGRHVPQEDSSGPSAQSGPRQKRNQVSRACDWCRLNRIRCDKNQPCRNCEVRGGECTGDRRGEVWSLPQAVKEIEHLKSQIKDLKAQLSVKRTNRASLGHSSPVQSENLQHDIQSLFSQWVGVWTNLSSPSCAQLRGPISTFYFAHRLSSFLHAQLDQHTEGDQTQGELSHRIDHSVLDLVQLERPYDDRVIAAEDMPNPEYLLQREEEYFLGLYWQSYFLDVPIVNEAEFRAHYMSLRTNTPAGQWRRPSSIVDIVIALAMQYGTTFIAHSSSHSGNNAKMYDGSDSSIAGWAYYQRSQTLLAKEMDRPSLNTLQCHLLSALYLRNASYHNMEHAALAVAVRLMYSLGLHREPSTHPHQEGREIRKRLYWCLYTAETCAAMTLGVPSLIFAPSPLVDMPNADAETARQSSAMTAGPIDGVTFLSYHVECAKLALASKAIANAFQAKYDSLLQSSSGAEPHITSQCFEELAEHHIECQRPLIAWMEECPDGLKNARRGSGRSFSTDRRPLELDHDVPLWLQRHRVLLELAYHDQAMCSYRPFIRFAHASEASSPLADQMALRCLQHAMASVNIIHQVLTESDALNGWYRAYKFTWNAALSILGFICDFPVSPSTQSARRAISAAVAVFDMFAKSSAVAATAVTSIQYLVNKVELLTDRLRCVNLPPSRNASISHSSWPNLGQLNNFEPSQDGGPSISPVSTHAPSGNFMMSSTLEDQFDLMGTKMDVNYIHSDDPTSLVGDGFSFSSDMFYPLDGVFHDPLNEGGDARPDLGDSTGVTRI